MISLIVGQQEAWTPTEKSAKNPETDSLSRDMMKCPSNIKAMVVEPKFPERDSEKLAKTKQGLQRGQGLKDEGNRKG